MEKLFPPCVNQREPISRPAELLPPPPLLPPPLPPRENQPGLPRHNTIRVSSPFRMTYEPMTVADNGREELDVSPCRDGTAISIAMSEKTKLSDPARRCSMAIPISSMIRQ